MNDWTKRNTPTGQRPEYPSAGKGQRSGDVRRTSRPQEPAPSQTPAVGEVLRAIEARGASPAYHRRALLELNDSWPTLVTALAALLREQGRTVPLEWRSAAR